MHLPDSYFDSTDLEYTVDVAVDFFRSSKPQDIHDVILSSIKSAKQPTVESIVSLILSFTMISKYSVIEKNDSLISDLQKCGPHTLIFQNVSQLLISSFALDVLEDAHLSQNILSNISTAKFERDSPWIFVLWLYNNQIKLSYLLDSKNFTHREKLIGKANFFFASKFKIDQFLPSMITPYADLVLKNYFILRDSEIKLLYDTNKSSQSLSKVYDLCFDGLLNPDKRRYVLKHWYLNQKDFTKNFNILVKLLLLEPYSSAKLPIYNSLSASIKGSHNHNDSNVSFSWIKRNLNKELQNLFVFLDNSSVINMDNKNLITIFHHVFPDKIYYDTAFLVLLETNVINLSKACTSVSVKTIVNLLGLEDQLQTKNLEQYLIDLIIELVSKRKLIADVDEVDMVIYFNYHYTIISNQQRALNELMSTEIPGALSIDWQSLSAKNTSFI